MNVILYITKRESWEQARLTGIYRGDTLGSEGFIHCSTPQQVIKVANALFHAQEGLVLLCIESDIVRLRSDMKGLKAGSIIPTFMDP